MGDDQWVLDTSTPTPHVVSIDRRPLSKRAKLVDRGLVDFRRVCDQMGILDKEADTIRSKGK